ncbi:MAG: helix-turn-helix domain-containing protein [Pseudomonadota bacterium]
MASSVPDTRRRILEAARALLETRGGSGVRMADIARRASVSRQAVYLHFKTRADLLIAVTLHIDDINDVAGRLAPSRAATRGVDRLDAYVEAWAEYLPLIRGVARALIALSADDEDAAAAWARRMADMREGCAAAVDALAADGDLTADLPAKEATDLLWALLSVETWDKLTGACGWTQAAYFAHVRTASRRLLMA